VEVCRNRSFEVLNERRIHIRIRIGNMETDESLAAQLVSILRMQPILMAFFHHKDDVGPTKVASSDPNTGTRLSSSGSCMMTVRPIEDALSRETPAVVLAANEEEFHKRAHVPCDGIVVGRPVQTATNHLVRACCRADCSRWTLIVRAPNDQR
jgi:hypothetical protein